MSKQNWVLKKNYEFQRVYRRGERVHCRSLILYAFQKKKGGRTRVGFAVVRQNGGAVRRNRLKRLLREAYRRLPRACKPGYDLLLTAKAPEVLPSFAQIQKDLRYALNKLQLLEEVGKHEGA